MSEEMESEKFCVLRYNYNYDERVKCKLRKLFSSEAKCTYMMRVEHRKIWTFEIYVRLSNLNKPCRCSETTESKQKVESPVGYAGQLTAVKR